MVEPDELPRRRDDGELLEEIYAEGERRRRRCWQAGGLGLSAALVAVVASAVLVARLQDGEPQRVATRGPSTPSVLGSSASPSTSVSPPVTSSVAVTPTTAVVSPAVASAASGTTVASTRPPTTATTAAPPTTTVTATVTTLACRNSTDSACGDFRWDPPPGPNAPLVIDVTATPRAVDPRTIDFAIAYSDADADQFSCRTVSYGDESNGEPGVLVEGGMAVCVQFSCAARFGAWTPPGPQPGRSQATTTHTYAKPGTYTATFSARSDYGCFEPYASSAVKTVTVTVP